MKRIQYIFFLMLAAFFVACEPSEFDKIEVGAAPTAEQLNFTVVKGSDDFHFTITNTSSVVGIANWDLGNGSKGSGNEVTAAYRLEGDYTITLTLFTKSGSATITKVVNQPKTDFSMFTDPYYINLSGGTDAINGKTWVLDSLKKGHIGVGDVALAGGVGLDWWSADPLAKTGCYMYDDEINFNINEFVATYTNHGKSYVKGYRTGATGYSMSTQNKDDYNVNFTPDPGAWAIVEKNGAKYLTMNTNTGKPIYPIFDVGAKNNEYKILELSANSLELVCATNEESWTAWHYYLIPKGYVRPSITYDFNHTEGVDNEYSLSLSNFSIPSGQSVTNVVWDFGDGSPTYSTTNKTEVVKHTYLRKGSYNITATVTTSLGTEVKSFSAVLANNNSAYTEYFLNTMVMYNDFGETQLISLGFDNAGSITTAMNPDKTMYPNRSQNCGLYSKPTGGSEWSNAFMKLPTGYRFDLRTMSTFKMVVYGKAGDKVLLKVENTDLGGNAWQTGVEFVYTIKATNKWEIAEFPLAISPLYNLNYYNVVRIMLNAGTPVAASVYIDDLAGPHIEGLKK